MVCKSFWSACTLWVSLLNAFGANVYSFVNTIPGSSLPPTMMMSSPSRLTAAALAWNFVSGRVLLSTVSHELALNKYLWTHYTIILLSNSQEIFSLLCCCREEKWTVLWRLHLGDEVEASLLDSEWLLNFGIREEIDINQTCWLGKPPVVFLRDIAGIINNGTWHGTNFSSRWVRPMNSGTSGKFWPLI